MRARARALCTKSLDLTWGAQLATRDSPSRLPRPGAHRCTHQVVHYTIFANYRLPNLVCSSKHLVTSFSQFTGCPPKDRTRINQREFGRRFSFVLRLTFLWGVTGAPWRRGAASGDGVSPRGPGRSHGRKFWLFERISKQKNTPPIDVQHLVRKLSSRSARFWTHRGCETGQKDASWRGDGQGGCTRRAGARARAPRHMRGRRAGAHL